jgi:hypothetical protein
MRRLGQGSMLHAKMMGGTPSVLFFLHDKQIES